MNASGIATPSELLVDAGWRSLWAQARSPMLGNSIAQWATLRRTPIAAYLTNSVFCLSLWMSLIAAIWLSKGWIGLFFSGQVLSTGFCLFETLFKRTHYAFSANSVPAHELENERYRSQSSADFV